MIECQCICACLERKDFSMFRLNDIDSEYFKDYKEEFKFIENHVKTYGNVPDLSTFLTRFPDFQLIEVAETEKYLIDKLKENYVYNSSVVVLKQAADKFKTIDSRDAVAFLLQKMPELNKKLSFEAVDLISNYSSRYNKYEERANNPDKAFYKTGIPQLDSIIGGIDTQEENAIITASTGQGKSWWAIFIGMSIAKQGYKVGYYSGEMSKDLVGWRLDTMYSHLSNFKITRGNRGIKDEYKMALSKMRDEVKGQFLCATPEDFGGAPTVAKLGAFIEKYDLDALIVDQLSLVKASNNTRDRYEAFSSISTELHLLQTMKKIPIISVVQLNRGANAKDVEDPGTEHIAGSNKIIEDATLALSVKQKQPNVLELRIMKGRNCPTGSKLTFTWLIDTFELTYVQTEDDAYVNHVKQQEKKGIKQKEKPQTEQEVYKDDYSGGDVF